MTDDPFARLVADLEAAIAGAASESEVLERAAPVVRDHAATTPLPDPAGYDWDAYGGGGRVLHQAADGGLNVWASAWRPGGEVPPHDHGTWAIIAGIEGEERNVLWRPTDAGLEHVETRVIGPGDVVCMASDAIHSVVNAGEAMSLSLHVYGRDLGAGRRQYDPESGASWPIGRDVE